MLDKLEDIAEAAVSVSAWKRGLNLVGAKTMAAGAKTMAATKAATRTSVQVATMGHVKVLQGGQGTESEVHTTLRATGGGDAAGRGQAAAAAAAAAAVALTVSDFFDGEPLLSAAACTRMSDLINVRCVCVCIYIDR